MVRAVEPERSGREVDDGNARPGAQRVSSIFDPAYRQAPRMKPITTNDTSQYPPLMAV